MAEYFVLTHDFRSRTSPNMNRETGLADSGIGRTPSFCAAEQSHQRRQIPGGCVNGPAAAPRAAEKGLLLREGQKRGEELYALW